MEPDWATWIESVLPVSLMLENYEKRGCINDGDDILTTKWNISFKMMTIKNTHDGLIMVTASETI